ncbi:hypothetical protein HZB60_12715 [candidate division KSB1 bacterium]|nr:hypothetical protein [candidate division KSB1 bacterium]
MPNRRKTGQWRWLVALIFIVAGVGSAQVRLDVSDAQVVLGSFCAEDHTQDLITLGSTDFRFTLDQQWRLVGRLNEPVRRIDDGLELPMDRARSLFPDVSDEFVGFQWFQVEYGPGSAEEQTWTFGWDVLQQRLVDYLDPADPPGVYRAFLDFALENRETGQLVSDPVAVLFEFEVLPWVELTLPFAWIFLEVSDPHSDVYSELFPVHVRSNAPWSMSLTWVGELIDDESGDQLSHSVMSWVVETGADWESLCPVLAEVCLEPTVLARGEGPEPFGLVEVDVPVLFQCAELGMRSMGNFGAQVAVDVSVELGVRQ